MSRLYFLVSLPGRQIGRLHRGIDELLHLLLSGSFDQIGIAVAVNGSDAVSLALDDTVGGGDDSGDTLTGRLYRRQFTQIAKGQVNTKRLQVLVVRIGPHKGTHCYAGLQPVCG